MEFGLLTLLPFSEVGGIDLYGREEKNLWLYRKLGSWVAVSAPCPGPGCPETACFVGKLWSVLFETVVETLSGCCPGGDGCSQDNRVSPMFVDIGEHR